MRNKILCIVAMLFIGLSAQAQISQPIQWQRVLVSNGSIVNTEADTITVPFSFQTKYQYNYVIQRTAVTGTTNITVVLQECNEDSGTNNWYTVATASGTGATTTLLQAAATYGLRHRIILTGGPSQTSTYRIHARLKKI